MSNYAQRYYPMQGSRAWETTSFPMVETFRITATGNGAANTTELTTFNKGSYILGFQFKVATSFTSTGAATLVLGFSTNCLVTSSLSIGNLDVGGEFGVSSTNITLPSILTADDTFDATSGTAPFNGGTGTVSVIYYPPPKLLGSDFKKYLST